MSSRDNFLPELYAHELANGMRLVGLEYSRTPWVSITFMAKRGAEADPPGKGGTADCLAETLTLGTQHRDQLALALDVEGKGAMLQAHGSWDHTTITVEGLAEDFVELMALLAEIVLEPGFPEEEFLLLRERRRAEVLHALDDPREVANRSYLPLFFGDSPYGHPVDGSPESLAALQLDDLRSFFHRQCHPQESSLVIVGMVPEAQALAITQQFWSAWRTPQAPAPAFQDTPPTLAQPGIYLLDRPDLTQSEIRCGHLGPPRSTPDFFALRLVNYILGGGGFSSRLMMRLRAEKGLTYGIRSQFHFRRAPGPFIISTFTPAEQTAEMIRGIQEVMREVQETGGTAAELADAQSYYVGSFPLGLETPAGLAQQIKIIELYDLGLDYLNLYRPRLLAVDRAAARAAAHHYLHPAELVILVVGPASRCRPALEKLGPVTLLATT
jgi:zinc protease